MSFIDDNDTLENIADKFAENNSIDGINAINEYFAKSKENLEKSITEKLLRQNPQPAPQNSNTSGGVTKEQFDKMTYNQRVELKTKDPELYKKLTK